MLTCFQFALYLLSTLTAFTAVGDFDIVSSSVRNMTGSFDLLVLVERQGWG